MKWTQEEVDLLYEEKSNIEIAELTGRTRESVRKKRYDLFGHYAERSKWQTKRPKRLPFYKTDDAIIKEARLLTLAKEMRVKLLGGEK